MLSRTWPRLVVVSFALIFCVVAIRAWRSDRRDRAQLAAELGATRQLLAAADARQRDRDAQLAKTLSALEAQKRAIFTPDQIIRELQKNVPLPEPVTLDQPSRVSEPSSGTIHRAPANSANIQASIQASQPTGDKLSVTTGPTQASAQPPAPDQVLLPRADLKPLYTYTLDCQACQAKLSVAQNDLADEKAKTAALTKERDDAVRIAKGGSAWRRVARAAKWFAIGAAVGAVAAKTH